MRSNMRALVFLCISALVLARLAAAQDGIPDTLGDRYRWLEEVHGERAMAWVRAENAKTMAVLKKDPRYAGIYRSALAMAQSTDRIPYASFLGGALYNVWQDSAHVRGLWRKTTLAGYRTRSPAWTTVLDLDSLARAENANWVWHGVICAAPAERRCLLQLSDGGEDAVTIREFDLTTRTFVKDGFVLPKGKQQVAWAGTDTLLVARAWTAADVTTSGYPFIVKRIGRGQGLDQAVEIFRGAASDGGYGVTPSTLVDGQGRRVSFVARPLTTFEAERYIVRAKDVARLDVPLKAEIADFVGGQIIVELLEDWKHGTTTISGGSVAAFDAGAAMRNPGALAPVTIFAPGPRESVAGVSATRDRLLVGLNHNVKGRVLAFARGANGKWASRPLSLPDNVTTNLLSADSKSDRALVGVTGFLTPTSIWLADAAAATAIPIKTMAAKFDASLSEVEQFEATSKDGTRVPYFILHPKAMKADGQNPTLLYAYGGFNVSMTPRYDEEIGKLWLERGGVYVLANIRGGAEFGPSWHEAGLKTRRQVIYDDFAAVAEDLIARKVTSPRRLGIQGGSNGGLLMGVQMTQRPELWKAVDIQVPLLDMLNYERIEAGASWVGEYGSVANPDERAFLAHISPLHNLKPGVAYPTPLVWTTTKDDRVGPEHARKFAARMSDLGLPYLFFEVIEGGHGSGANIEQRAHTAALEFTYMARQLMDGSRLVP